MRVEKQGRETELRITEQMLCWSVCWSGEDEYVLVLSHTLCFSSPNYVDVVGRHRSPPLPISMGWERLWRLPLTALLRAKSWDPVEDSPAFVLALDSRKIGGNRAPRGGRCRVHKLLSQGVFVDCLGAPLGGH